MPKKIIPRCPACDHELDHVDLTYGTVYPFSVENVEEGEVNWDNCIGEGTFDNMYFWCPSCETKICTGDPDAMVEFLLGKEVEFIKNENFFDCIGEKRE